jgi:hypothetical protein
MIVHRHVLGVMAATVAAPYLVMLIEYLFNNNTRGLTGLWSGIQAATMGLVVFGLPTLILAGICAAILHRLGLQTRGWCMLGGAGVGLSFLGLTQLLPGSTMNIGFWPLLVVLLDFPLSGVLCGWICWRIALRGIDHPISDEDRSASHA